MPYGHRSLISSRISKLGGGRNCLSRRDSLVVPLELPIRAATPPGLSHFYKVTDVRLRDHRILPTSPESGDIDTQVQGAIIHSRLEGTTGAHLNSLRDATIG